MRRARLSSFLPAIALAASLPLQAAEWSAEPSVSLRTGYNDNIRLTAADHDAVWETVLSPAVRFGVAREHQGIFGTARTAIRRYAGGSGRESSDALNREDYFLETDAYHRTLLNVFRMNLDYKETSTFDAELDEFGNVVNQETTREESSVNPSWDRVLNERTRLHAAYRFTSVDFPDDPGITDLVPYDYDLFNASLVRQFSPRTRGTLSTSYSRYRPDARASTDSDTLSLQAGISRNFSETLSVSFLAGQRKTTSDTQVLTGYCVGAEPGASFPDCSSDGNGFAVPTGFATDETENTGSVYSASLTKALETGFLSATVTRASNPTSNGQILDTTRLIFAAQNNLSETLRASLTAEYNTRETIVNRLGRPGVQKDRNLLRIRPGLAWNWRREWRIEGRYEYAENDNQGSSAKAQRHALYLTLTFRPTRISVSR
jgi:hypothetical protein